MSSNPCHARGAGRCAAECACNYRFQPSAEDMLLLRKMQVVWTSCQTEDNITLSCTMLLALSVVETLLTRADACTTSAARVRLAHLLSVPVLREEPSYVHHRRRGATWMYVCLSKDFCTESQLTRLLNIGPCWRLGVTWTGWRCGDLQLPDLQAVPVTATVFDGFCRRLSASCHIRYNPGALLLAGGLPFFYNEENMAHAIPGASCSLGLWRRQWRAWHGRKSRRLWTTLLVSLLPCTTEWPLPGGVA
jgi:hypothetical protein